MSLSKHRNPCRSCKSHDVFISFRGEDTRGTLICHLSNYFRNSGIDAFFDQVHIKAGDNIRKKLRRAIQSSKIYVPVFSKNYPDSNTCLWELDIIVEEVSKIQGNKQILPILYGVKREDLRLRTDLYAQKVSQHNETESTQTVQRWKKALQYVAEIEGLANYDHDDDADLCQQILERVRKLIGPREPLVVNRQLSFRGLPNLRSLEGLDLMLASSKTLIIEDCGTLEFLFSLPGRKNLHELKIHNCEKLTDVPYLGELQSLKVFIIEECSSLKRLPDLSKLGELEELYITSCPNLGEVIGLSKLESLRSMEISDCGYIEYVEISLFKLNKLENFVLENCGNLRRLGDGFSSENLQLPSGHPFIRGCPLLGSKLPVEPDRNDNDDDDDDNLQLSSDHEEHYSKRTTTTSCTPTPSASVFATDDHAVAKVRTSRHHQAVSSVGVGNGKHRVDMSSSSSTFPMHNGPSSTTEELMIYEQLSSLLDPQVKSPQVFDHTKEAKAVLKRFRSGGIERLEEESFDLMCLLDAAKSLSLANPSDKGFSDHFSSKIQLASSSYKLNLERVQTAEAIRGRYSEIMYKVLKDKTDHIEASKEKIRYEINILRAHLAELEKEVDEDDHHQPKPKDDVISERAGSGKRMECV